MPNTSLSLDLDPAELRHRFFSLRTPSDLTSLLDIDGSRLHYYLHQVPVESRYEIFEIPKSSGGTRRISAPATALKIIQSKLNQVLQSTYHTKLSVHGFVTDRSIVTNARPHVGRRYVFNIDLLDFFPSINFGRVRGMFMGWPYRLNADIATLLAQICCHANELPQGAPSSPIISNMLCAQMDSQLLQLAQTRRCTYTRYADDITFSTNLAAFPSALATLNSLGQLVVGAELTGIINGNGFQINPQKVRLQQKGKGRLEVTGVVVNEKLNVRRTYIRQLSAMLNAWEQHGLAAAHSEFRSRYDTKRRDTDREDLFFEQVVKGKIEFLGMVRGQEDAIYRKFLSKYHALTANPIDADDGITLPADPLTHYENGLRKLRNRVEVTHPRYIDILSLEARLRENIRQTRTTGNNDTLQSDRNVTVLELNRIAIEVLGLPFNDLC